MSLAELFDIYQTCFNQIYTFVCLLFNANVRVIVPQLGDTLIDVILDKVVRKVAKSVNNWHWLHIHLSATQSKIQELSDGVGIVMIFGSQLVLNVSILDFGGRIDVIPLIFILEKSRFCQCIRQSSGWSSQYLSTICWDFLDKQLGFLQVDKGNIEGDNVKVDFIHHFLLE